MCRGKPICTELSDPALFHIEAILPPPQWMRDEIRKFTAAVNAAARGEREIAFQILAGVRGQEIQDWCIEHGQVAGSKRISRLGGVRRAPLGQHAEGPRMGSAIKAVVFQRDSYHCRYCGIPIIDLSVFPVLTNYFGAHFFNHRKPNKQRHGIAMLAAGYCDHVVPFSAGGRTTVENLVSCCWTCNYGKEAFTLEQLQISDPRLREPIVSEWDGLLKARDSIAALSI